MRTPKLYLMPSGSSCLASSFNRKLGRGRKTHLGQCRCLPTKWPLRVKQPSGNIQNACHFLGQVVVPTTVECAAGCLTLNSSEQPGGNSGRRYHPLVLFYAGRREGIKKRFSSDKGADQRRGHATSDRCIKSICAPRMIKI